MRRFCYVGLLLMALTVGAVAAPRQLADGFETYPVGSGGGPGWRAMDIGFAVRGGAGSQEMVADAPGGRGIAVWQAAPVARALTLEATVTPREASGQEWKTAGIGLFVNGDNFWHLAFVERPDAQDKGHYVELSEMLGGVWNAQDEGPTHLVTVEDSGPFAWRFGQSYRLRLTLGTDRITGEVFEGKARRYRCVRRLSRQALSFGRPMLTASGLTVAFDDVRADGIQPADLKAVAKMTGTRSIPPYPGGNAKTPTSFFHTRRQGQTWWLVDPRGRTTLALGTDHVNYNELWCEDLGYAPYHRNVAAKYGSEAAWANVETRRLRAWHFNTLGAGSSPQTRYRGLAHTEFLAFGTDFSSTAALVPKTTWTGWPDVFDPRWERFCDLRAAERCDPERRDPWLLGYFLDNEMEWWGKHGRPWGLAEEAWRLPAERAGKRALMASLRRFYGGDVARFNADFGTTLAGFDGLGAIQEPAQPHTARGEKALMGFVGEAAKRYFEIATAAVRRHDPNHLILGCRFAHDAPPDAWRQAGRTCDVVSVNMYPRIDFDRAEVTGLAEHLRPRYAWCRRPIMLTEWSFPALDAKDTQGHPLPSKHGAGMRVDTQAQRARAYTIMQQALFRLPFVVGSDYFMWVDDPSPGVSHAFPEDSNYGLVSEADVPYPALTAAATRINAQMVALHGGKITPPVPTPPASVATSIQAVSGPPPTFTKTATGYTLENARLRLVKDRDDGDIFDHIYWRDAAGGDWIELGRYGPLLVQDVGGQNTWVSADRVTGVQTRTDGTRTVLDMTFEKAAGAGNPEARPFRGAYRVTLEVGQPYFQAQCLWMENTGSTAWRWHGYLHYTPSRLGGDAADDVVGGPDVPNYWLPFGAWRDPKLGLDYGALPVRPDERLTFNFWKDESGGQHPDCYRQLDLELTPGRRWRPAAPEPTVAIFGLRETPRQPRPWVGLLQSLRR